MVDECECALTIAELNELALVICWRWFLRPPFPRWHLELSFEDAKVTFDSDMVGIYAGR
jgi:hypothetical protein